MKFLFLVLSFLFLVPANSQDEFAANSFYQDLKKVFNAGQSGFNEIKGEAIKSLYPELQTEFKTKIPLQPADSGKLVYPVTGRPFAVYFFEPSKNRIKTDQKALSLRDAIQTSYGSPLYVLTMTNLVDKRPFTNSYFFTDPNEMKSANAVFRTSIYYQDDKYYLSLEVRGKKFPD